MKKNTTRIFLLSSIFVACHANALTIFEDENGDYLRLYGEVGVGGHFGANYEYGEFYTADDSYIDDSFGTIGLNGLNGKIRYAMEIDYERENWLGGSGDMVATVDKMHVGYDLPSPWGKFEHYIEVGLTDTAFDDYDAFGDFTFDTAVETGEAGDQDKTIKYEARYGKAIRAALSYSYKGETESGAEQGDIVNGYIGYFGEKFSGVVGLEGRGGSDGKSKYGKQRLVGLAMTYAVSPSIELGFNGFYEKSHIAQTRTAVDLTDPLNKHYVFNDYEEETNKGALISGKYTFNPKWELIFASNYEENEAWDEHSRYWDGDTSNSWGESRTWNVFGFNHYPTKSTVLSFEIHAGEAPEKAYGYARVYF